MTINPSDPCVTVFQLEEGGEDIVPFEIAHGERPRASVQRRYAEESGLDFADVRCLRSYIVIHSWAEAWEDSSDQHYQIETGLERDGFVEDTGYRVDDFGNRYWLWEQEGEGWGITDEVARERYGQLPPDWHPEFIWGAYSTVDKWHPGAIPVWVCEPW